jgi:alkylated DNA repair dioxygenase AlkB
MHPKDAFDLLTAYMAAHPNKTSAEVLNLTPADLFKWVMGEEPQEPEPSKPVPSDEDDDWNRAAQKPQEPQETPSDQITAWRFEQLQKAGYDVTAARMLASEPWHKVDLHTACWLVEQGCPQDLALRILS